MPKPKTSPEPEPPADALAAPEPSGLAVNCAFDELVPVERLIPNPRNPNRHPEGQIRALAKIIAYQGWRSPIVVSKRSGFIVAGHGRLEAAKLLQVSTVPIDFQDFASEADEWAHLIADNRLAELAETDEAALKEILGELQAGEFDPELAGYDQGALDQLLAEPTPPDDFPEVDEDLPTDSQCPKCGYQWSGKPS
jgi:ParB-like chromosome segregation protein Spo0J